jgi:hypothetical protein
MQTSKISSKYPRFPDNARDLSAAHHLRAPTEIYPLGKVPKPASKLVTMADMREVSKHRDQVTYQLARVLSQVRVNNLGTYVGVVS